MKIPAPIVIDPNAVFSRELFGRTFGLSPATIGREVKAGRLVARRRCKSYWFLGSDILAWLRDGKVTPRNGDAATAPESR